MANESFASLTSFSGADLCVSFGKRIIGELQQISWAVQREKAPVFTLGSPNARSISRGKRGIAGSLVFAVFDRDALREEMKAQWADIAPKRMFTATGNLMSIVAYDPRGQAPADNFDNLLSMADWNQRGNAGLPQDKWSDGSAIDGGELDLPKGFSLMHVENITYIDQIPPIDVTMTFANEYGQAAFQKIYDMDFLNEASGVSVDTIIMERQVTWIARNLSPIMQGVYKADSMYGNPNFVKPAGT